MNASKFVLLPTVMFFVPVQAAAVYPLMKYTFLTGADAPFQFDCWLR